MQRQRDLLPLKEILVFCNVKAQKLRTFSGNVTTKKAN